MQPILLYITVKNKPEAVRLAETLLAEKRIACANIISGVTSLYRWEEKLQQEEEAILIAKTTPEAQEQAMARIAELHGYDCPCIVALDTAGAHPPFAEWIFSQIGD